MKNIRSSGGGRVRGDASGSRGITRGGGEEKKEKKTKTKKKKTKTKKEATFTRPQ